MKYSWIIILIVIGVNAILRAYAKKSEALAKANASKAQLQEVMGGAKDGAKDGARDGAKLSAAESQRDAAAERRANVASTRSSSGVAQPASRPAVVQRAAAATAPAPRRTAASASQPAATKRAAAHGQATRQGASAVSSARGKTPPPPPGASQRRAPAKSSPPTQSSSPGSTPRAAPVVFIQRSEQTDRAIRLERQISHGGARHDTSRRQNVGRRTGGLGVSFPVRAAVRSRRDLRMALVMSEILNPPVSERTGSLQLPR